VLGKNAINTIRGIVFRKEFQNLPVYVSFSGGKDSLVVLDLAQASLKQRNLKLLPEHRNRISGNC